MLFSSLLLAVHTYSSNKSKSVVIPIMNLRRRLHTTRTSLQFFCCLRHSSSNLNIVFPALALHLAAGACCTVYFAPVSWRHQMQSMPAVLPHILRRRLPSGWTATDVSCCPGAPPSVCPPAAATHTHTRTARTRHADGASSPAGALGVAARAPPASPNHAPPTHARPRA